MTALYRHVSEVVGDAIAEVELRHEYGDDLGGLRTGIACLDARAREALMPGSLIVVAGESGRGKTAFMAQLAVAFAAQTPTMLVTLEDAAQDSVKRAIANISRTNVGRIRAGFSGETSIPTAFTDAADALSGLNLHFLDGFVPTMDRLLNQLWHFREDHPDGGAVLIDQLSHIIPSGSEMVERYRANGLPTPPPASALETKVYEWMCWVLKEAAQKFNLVIVLAHQLNEAHGDGEPTERSIRGSRGIVHKADLVLIPWRPAMIDNPFSGPGEPDRVPNTTGEAILKAVKARSIEEFRESVVWCGGEQRFADPADVNTAYTAPAPPTDRALEGKRRLVALREALVARRAAAIKAAQVAELGRARHALTGPEGESDGCE